MHFDVPAIGPATASALNRILDALERLDILDSRESKWRRDNPNIMYGKPKHYDAIRECDGHMEYRPPASWLDSPGQALAVLTAMKLAAHAPGSAKWNPENPKVEFMSWLCYWGNLDVDAWLLNRLIAKRGFKEVQADPSKDFKPNWRKEELWTK